MRPREDLYRRGVTGKCVESGIKGGLIQRRGNGKCIENEAKGGLVQRRGNWEVHREWGQGRTHTEEG